MSADLIVKELTINDEGLKTLLECPRALAEAWVAAAIEMLAGGENYSETVVHVNEGLEDPPVKAEMEVGLAYGERYLLRVQRVGRLTPHQARRMAEAERDQLRERVAELEEKIYGLEYQIEDWNNLYDYWWQEKAGPYAPYRGNGYRVDVLDKGEIDRWR